MPVKAHTFAFSSERMGAVASSSSVKGSDAKKLRRSLIEQYPLVSEVQWQELWPAGTKEITLSRLADKTAVFHLDGRPLFYTTKGGKGKADGWLHPTLYVGDK